jgi:hypothetical protein
MIKFAIRNQRGEYRSASWSDSFGDWDGAQLWDNAKTVKNEIKRQEKRTTWVHGFDGPSKASVKVPLNLKCELVAVNIAEPA